MSASTCAFCHHENPSSARYCNDCASPLALKPCRVCDAVNARPAGACHRCRTPFAVEPPAGADVSTETIVAQADATLAALRRELEQATAHVSAATMEAQAPAPAASGVSQAPALRPEALVATVPEAPLPRGEHFITLDDAMTAPRRGEADVLPVRDDPAAAVVLRGRRASPALAVAAIALLLALPLALYAWRNPDQLQSWIARLEVMARSVFDAPVVTEGEGRAGKPPPVAAPAVLPAPVDPGAPVTASESPPSTSSGTVETPAATPGNAPEAVTAGPAGQPPAQASANEPAPAPAAAMAPASPVTKSTASPRSRASANKSRSRERVQRQRGAPSSAASTRPAPQADAEPAQ